MGKYDKYYIAILGAVILFLILVKVEKYVVEKETGKVLGRYKGYTDNPNCAEMTAANTDPNVMIICNSWIAWESNLGSGVANPRLHIIERRVSLRK